MVWNRTKIVLFNIYFMIIGFFPRGVDFEACFFFLQDLRALTPPPIISDLGMAYYIVWTKFESKSMGEVTKYKMLHKHRMKILKIAEYNVPNLAYITQFIA